MNIETANDTAAIEFDEAFMVKNVSRQEEIDRKKKNVDRILSMVSGFLRQRPSLMRSIGWQRGNDLLMGVRNFRIEYDHRDKDVFLERMISDYWHPASAQDIPADYIDAFHAELMPAIWRMLSNGGVSREEFAGYFSKLHQGQ